MPEAGLNAAAKIAKKAHHYRSLRYRLGAFTLKSNMFFFKFAAYIKAVPFELSSNNRLQVKLFDAFWQRWLWYFVSLVVHINATFQVVSFGWNVHQHGMTDEAAIHVMYMVLAILSVLYFWNALHNPHQLVMLINQMEFLMRIIRARNLGGRKWHDNLFCILVVNYFAIMELVLITPALALRQVLQPNGPMYMTAIFGNGLRDQHPGMDFALMGLEIALSYWKCSILVVYFCLWNAAVFQNLIWMDQLIANQKSSAAIHCLRPFQERAAPVDGTIKTYRFIQLLNVFHNDLNMYFSAVCIVSLTGHMFVSLTAFKLLSIYMYLPFPVFSFFCIVLITVFYGYLSLWKIKSEDFLGWLKKETRSGLDISKVLERNVTGRDIKSLRPITNKLAHFGHTCIAVSQGSIEEVYNEVLLLMSL